MVSSTALHRRATCEQPSRTTLPRDHRDCVRSGTNPDGTTRQDAVRTQHTSSKSCHSRVTTVAYLGWVYEDTTDKLLMAFYKVTGPEPSRESEVRRREVLQL